MIVLRCISFAIGSLVLTGAPFFLLPDAPQRASDVWEVLAGCAVIALLSAGFLLVGVAGNHMKRSRRTRMLGGALLALPIMTSFALLFIDNVPESAWMIGPVTCWAAFLFITFVYPRKRSQLHRRMRPRDPVAPLTEA
jgi:UDP-N-acetylmuramyl pentapeptide phosphotransferase/UDP-N-acetylglucosamine-1-phosphate transferase